MNYSTSAIPFWWKLPVKKRRFGVSYELFLLDLVEAQIIYMPVYPTDERVEFNHHFLYQSPNILSEILPDAVNLQDLIRVIDIYAVTNGEYLQVVADPQEQKAICYIEKSDISGSAGA